MSGPSSSNSYALPTSISTNGGTIIPENTSNRAHGHGRRQSISDAARDAIRAGRKRAASVTASEVVENVKVPVSWKLIALCLVWYLSSALSNTSSKSILNAFPHPVTLTLLQFAFVFIFSLLLMSASRYLPATISSRPRYPTREILLSTAPLGIFQVAGHIASSIATSLIAVSLVHTIKGMSPLFTVAAYRGIFKVRYSTATYISLIPLTVGVMLACAADWHGHVFGIFMAFLGALVFVTQNIWSKKLFSQSNTPGKLDKLNLLLYSSAQAFIFTFPVWIYSESSTILTALSSGTALATHDRHGNPVTITTATLLANIFFNGIVHFGQNIIAFILLAMVSPVTYSVASLIKRIFVIVMAIVWFGAAGKTTMMQWVGIGLTFFGLYLYDRAGDEKRHGGRRVVGRVKEEGVLGGEGKRPLLPVAEKGDLEGVTGLGTGSVVGGVGRTSNGGVWGEPGEVVVESPVGFRGGSGWEGKVKQ